MADRKMYGQGIDAQLLNTLGAFSVVDNEQRAEIIKQTTRDMNAAYREIHQEQMRFISEENRERLKGESLLIEMQMKAARVLSGNYDEIARKRFDNLDKELKRIKDQAKTQYDNMVALQKSEVEHKEKMRQDDRGFFDNYFKNLEDKNKRWHENVAKQSQKAGKEAGEAFNKAYQAANGGKSAPVALIEEASRKIADETARSMENALSNIKRSISTILSSGTQYASAYMGLNSMGKYDVLGSLNSGGSAAYDLRKQYGAYGMNALKDISEGSYAAQLKLQERGLAIGPNQMNKTMDVLQKSYNLAGRSHERLVDLLEAASSIEKGVAKFNTDSDLARQMEFTAGTDSWKMLIGALKDTELDGGASADLMLSGLQSSSESQAMLMELIRTYEKNPEELSRQFQELSRNMSNLYSGYGSVGGQSIVNVISGLMGGNALAQMSSPDSAMAASIAATRGYNILTDKASGYNFGVMADSYTSGAQSMGQAFGNPNLNIKGALGVDVGAFTAANDYRPGYGTILPSGQYLTKDQLIALSEDIASDTPIDIINAQTETEAFYRATLTYQSNALAELIIMKDATLQLKSALGIGGSLSGVLGNVLGNALGNHGGKLLKGLLGSGAGGTGAGIAGALTTAAPLLLATGAGAAAIAMLVDSSKTIAEATNRTNEILQPKGEESSNTLNSGAKVMVSYDPITGKIMTNTETVEINNAADRQNLNRDNLSNSLKAMDQYIQSNSKARGAFERAKDANVPVDWDNYYRDTLNSGNITDENYDRIMNELKTGQLSYIGNSFRHYYGKDAYNGLNSIIDPVKQTAIESSYIKTGLYRVYSQLGLLQSSANPNGISNADFVKNYSKYRKALTKNRLVYRGDGSSSPIDIFGQNVNESDITSARLETVDYMTKNGYADGLSNVPYNGFKASLHQGEMVLPSKKANFIRQLFGEKPVAGGGVPETGNNGVNSFVQSLPDYMQGDGDSFAAGVDSYNSSQKALSYALGKIGSPYVWGAKGPNEFDCSGLVSWAYGQATGGDHRTNANGWGKRTMAISQEDALPGDIVVRSWGPHKNSGKIGWRHVGMVSNVGGTMVVHAKGRKYGVVNESTSSASPKWDRFGRYVGMGNEKLNNASQIIDVTPTGGVTSSLGSGGLFNPEGLISQNSSILKNWDLLQNYSSNPYIAAIIQAFGGSGANIDNNSMAGNFTGSDYQASNAAFESNSYKDLLTKYGSLYGINPRLLYGMMMRESSGNPNSNLNNSSNSHKGLMNVKSSYFSTSQNPYDPETNISVAMKYLKDAIIKTGYLSLGIGGYNTGPGLDGWQTARKILDGGGTWEDLLSQMNVSDNMKGFPNNLKTSYINKVYQYAGLPLKVPYLSEGGIATEPTLAMIGEDPRRNEAVLPLNKDNSLIGLDDLKEGLLDGLDDVCVSLINKLDEIVKALSSAGINISSEAMQSKSYRMERMKNFGR